MTRRSRTVAGALVVAIVSAWTACDRGPTVEELAVPAGPFTAEPGLTGDGQRIYLSWIRQPEGTPPELRFAGAPAGPGPLDWGDPTPVVSSDTMFVNWADFPSLLPLGGATLAAHWLRRSGEGTYAYDAVLTLSQDGGRSWSAGVPPHRDGTEAEHGFVSLVPDDGESLIMVWLDGRRMALAGTADPATQLMVSHWDGTGFGPEVVLDDRVCDCCQTAAVRTSDGMLVAYRDRDGNEVRDISVVRLDADGWSDPQTVHPDGWRIAGCPVNGPALASHGSRVGLTWYTASPAPAVLLTWSEDEGRTFGSPLRVDDAVPLGRTSIAALDDGSLVVVWLEQGPDQGRALVRARRYPATGAPQATMTVAETGATRSSGFPRVLAGPGRVWIAWTDSGPPLQVRLARIDYRERG